MTNKLSYTTHSDLSPNENTVSAQHSEGKNLSDSHSLFFEEVMAGLTQKQKTLPCKYFYDEKGSQLFEQICQLDEYYLTRTELSLLENIKKELAKMVGENATIIEPGAGAGIKIRTLLNALDSPECYVPMDISKEFLFYSAQVIQKKFPEINIIPLQGDFTQPVQWLDKKQSENKVVFFPGSTIGNFDEKSAIEFLKNMHNLIGGNGAMIIGIDLLKEKSVLEAAYDDDKGVTAAFNKNLLRRINNDLNANFDLTQFTHKAFLNNELQRIEMHLVSDKEQTVIVNGNKVYFFKGESIHTENSHKYTNESFINMASTAKLKSIKTWIDDQKMFAVHYLVRS